MPKFRVLAGVHEERGRDNLIRRYRYGDVVDSKSDLDAKFNRGRGRKFEVVGSEVKASPGVVVGGPRKATLAPASAAAAESLAGLEGKSLRELQDIAAAEEIDLKGARAKDDVLKVLREALAPAG